MTLSFERMSEAQGYERQIVACSVMLEKAGLWHLGRSARDKARGYMEIASATGAGIASEQAVDWLQEMLEELQSAVVALA